MDSRHKREIEERWKQEADTVKESETSQSEAAQKSHDPSQDASDGSLQGAEKQSQASATATTGQQIVLRKRSDGQPIILRAIPFYKQGGGCEEYIYCPLLFVKYCNIFMDAETEGKGLYFMDSFTVCVYFGFYCGRELNSVSTKLNNFLSIANLCCTYVAFKPDEKLKS